jgi:hypothetical protein
MIRHTLSGTSAPYTPQFQFAWQVQLHMIRDPFLAT